MNNEELLEQAQQFCSYSATHSPTPQLALFWNNLRTVFAQATIEVREGRRNIYRDALISAAHYLNEDLLSDQEELTLTPTEGEPDGE